VNPLRTVSSRARESFIVVAVAAVVAAAASAAACFGFVGSKLAFAWDWLFHSIMYHIYWFIFTECFFQEEPMSLFLKPAKTKV